MKILTSLLILIGLSLSIYGQNFEVPDSILKDLKSRQFEYTHTAEFNYKITFPVNYNDTTIYVLFLGLSGGNASDKIVDYCFYTLFDSKYFDNYITVMPLGPSGRPLSDLDSTEINYLIADIMKQQKVTNHNWI